MPVTTIRVNLGSFHYLLLEMTLLNGTEMMLTDFALFANVQIFEPQIFVCR